MLVNKKNQDYCGAEHFFHYTSQIEHKFSLAGAGDRPRGRSRLKINCVETKVSSETMNFFDIMGKIFCRSLHGWPRMERKGDRSSKIISVRGYCCLQKIYRRKKIVASSPTFIALVCVYLHASSIKCFAEKFVLPTGIYLFCLTKWMILYLVNLSRLFVNISFRGERLGRAKL